MNYTGQKAKDILDRGFGTAEYPEDVRFAVSVPDRVVVNIVGSQLDQTAYTLRKRFSADVFRPINHDNVASVTVSGADLWDVLDFLTGRVTILPANPR